MAMASNNNRGRLSTSADSATSVASLVVTDMML